MTVPSKPPARPHSALQLPPLLFWLIVLASLALGYGVITQLDVGIGDEDVHRFQMNWFVQGRYEIFEHVTVLPLYHLVVAKLAQWTGLTSLNGFRFVHMVFAAGAIPAFFMLCRALYPAQAAIRTAQFMLIPFLFPLFFLTYTDLPALLFVFLMLERTLRQQYFVASVLALVAVAMRQPNIVWVGFACGLIALHTADEMSVRWRLRAGDGEKGLLAPEYLLTVWQRARYLVAVVCIFAAFVVWNGGIAVGDVEQHRLSLNLSNLYFCLMVAFILFLPFNIGQLGDIKRLLRRHWWIGLVLIASFFVYFTTYEHPHKYNTLALEFYRHNLLIYYTSDITPIRIAAFVPMAWMALSCVTAARASEYGKDMLLLLPFALMSFVPLPLIEPRYYLAALSLFLVFRPAVSNTSNIVTLVYYVLASAYILFNISRQAFFI